MGDVILLEPHRPKETVRTSPTIPAWRRDLLSAWLDEGNWRSFAEGERRFEWRRCFVALETATAHSGWKGWAFAVYPGYGRVEVSNMSNNLSLLTPPFSATGGSLCPRVRGLLVAWLAQPSPKRPQRGFNISPRQPRQD